MSTLSKIACLLTLFLICCTKSKTVFHEKNHPIIFNKKYKNLTTLKKENYLDSLGDLLRKTKENDTLTRNLHLELATELDMLT